MALQERLKASKVDPSKGHDSHDFDDSIPGFCRGRLVNRLDGHNDPLQMSDDRLEDLFD